MENDLFSKVNGKALIIYDFDVMHTDRFLRIKMDCVDKDQNCYFIVFENVSKLKISYISYPFQICGFEILDYSLQGYQKDLHFFVNDYEEEKLSFFCEDFEIFNSSK